VLCLLANVSANEINPQTIAGLWWAADGRMSNAIEIDKLEIHTGLSRGTVGSDWSKNVAYRLIRNDGKTYIEYTQHQTYKPEIRLLNENTLELNFPENQAPNWNTSRKGEALLFRKAPKIIDEEFFYGLWNSSDSGFKSLTLSINSGGTANILGAVSEAELCWEKSDSTVTLNYCNPELPDPISIVMRPTHVRELVIVTMSGKATIWQRQGAGKLTLIEPLEK